jgi:hypothetical protein
VGAVQLDAEGCLFIDRCPDSFRFVLDHLNGNPLHMDTMTRSEREMLALDAEFYELDELRGDNKTLAISPHAPVCVPNASREENQLLLPFIQEAMNHLARRKAEWDAERAASVRIEQKVASAIGGEKVKLQFQEERCQFSTCVATLTRTPSMLAHKFADASWRKEVCEDDGTIFISRSGQTFALVLNVLRGYPSPTHLSAEQRRLFLLDLDYYGLPPLPPQTVDRAPQPRRPMTAYLYFQAERQNDENNSGRMDWKALTEEQKRPFNERAAEDKARYEREKRAWKKQNL